MIGYTKGIGKRQIQGGSIFHDLSGMRFGKLMVMKRMGAQNGHSVFECLCDCGKTTQVKACDLKTRTLLIKSCGCVKRIGSHFKDITGQKIGRLLVLERMKNKPGRTESRWLCQCDCGNKTVVSISSLHRTFQPHSCGCAIKEASRLEPGLAAKKYMFRITKAHSKRRGIDWNLNFDQYIYLCEKPCAYCGIAPSKEQTGCKGHAPHYGAWTHGGIDRKDTSSGYLIDNCVPCCKDCNIAKMTLSVTDFQSHIRRIFNHVWMKVSTSESYPYRRFQGSSDFQGHHTYRDARLHGFKQLQHKANVRWGECCLSYKQWLDVCEQPCVYCGAPPYKVLEINKQGGLWTHGGVDRIDNAKGYALENCVPCCEVCNVMKATMSQQAFLAHVKRIHLHGNPLDNPVCPTRRIIRVQPEVHHAETL